MGKVHMLTLMLLVPVVAQLTVGLASSCGCLMHSDKQECMRKASISSDQWHILYIVHASHGACMDTLQCMSVLAGTMVMTIVSALVSLACIYNVVAGGNKPLSKKSQSGTSRNSPRDAPAASSLPHRLREPSSESFTGAQVQPSWYSCSVVT